MSDTFTTIIIIVIGTTLLFMVPLVSVARRNDETSEQIVQKAIVQFNDEIRYTATVTQEEYDRLLEVIEATGNKYELNIAIHFIDENPAKKTASNIAESVKLGENVYYVAFNTQIEELFDEYGGVIKLDPGDYVTIDAEIVNQTLYQSMKKGLYSLTGMDTSAISGSHTVLVMEPASGEYVDELYDTDTSIQYTISYDANGGEAASVPAAQTKYTNQRIYISTTVPTRANMEFKYWNTKADGSGKIYGRGVSYDLNQDVTLYAIWGDVTYSVEYWSNTDATSGMLIKKDTGYTLNSSYTVNADDPTRGGYNFKGWNTNADGTGTTYVKTNVMTITDNVKLYAIWERKSYTIEFQMNISAGKTPIVGVPATITKLHDARVYIPNEVPEVEGDVFIAWNTMPDGSGVRYEPGQEITENKDLTLFAIWRNEIEYTVRYDANTTDTVNNMPAAATKKWDTNIRITDVIPTRNGYTFKEWNTNADGTGKKYAPYEEYMANESIVLYAIWTPGSLTVTFNYNNATSGNILPSMSATYDSPYGTLPTPAKSYSITWNPNGGTVNPTSSALTYTFGGWYKENTFTNLVDSSSTVTTPNNHTLHAKWTRVNVTMPTPTRAGHSFSGWYTEQTGGTLITSIPDLTSNVTYYAHWNEEKYTVTYNANTTDTVTNLPSGQTVVYNGTYTISENEVSRYGYVFKGWSTSATSATADPAWAGGTQHTMGQQSVVLYAVWEFERLDIVISGVVQPIAGNLMSKIGEHNAEYRTEFAYKLQNGCIDMYQSNSNEFGSCVVYASMTAVDVTDYQYMVITSRSVVELDANPWGEAHANTIIGFTPTKDVTQVVEQEDVSSWPMFVSQGVELDESGNLVNNVSKVDTGVTTQIIDISSVTGQQYLALYMGDCMGYSQLYLYDVYLTKLFP